MMLRQRFFQLDAGGRRQVHLSLCEDALTVWTGYIREKPTALRYRDSVAGTRQRVDVDLPADALRAARAGVDLSDIGGRYLEPITALQNDELVFPDPVEFAYYAIYNCFRKYAGGHDIDDWLITNQALSVHDHTEAAPRLTHALDAIDPAASGET